MKKRFKTNKHHNKYLKIISFILIIYIFFNLFYNLLYNLYLSKLTNKEIINHIIKNTKNNKNSFNILKNPQYILSDDFTIKKDSINTVKEIPDNVEIYIYSTHETEEYSDKYLEVYNIKPNVKTISYILKDYLTDLGINTYVEEKSVTDVLHSHNWSYKYSYDATREIISPYIQENPKLKLIIDLHRDSSSLNKTLLSYNNTNYARILFVVGEEHQEYEKNYKLAEILNNYLNEEIPNITRGILKKGGPGVNGIYNQDLSSKSVLIELGGQYNEIEEINNTLNILAKCILKYIEGIKWKIVKKVGLSLEE